MLLHSRNILRNRTLDCQDYRNTLRIVIINALFDFQPVRKKGVGMNNSAAKFIILALFFAFATILSCGGEEREPQAPPPHEEEKMEHMEKTMEDDGDKAETETDFTNEQQKAYIDSVHEQMMVIGEKIRELKDHTQTKEGEVRETLDQELNELTALYEKTTNELAHIKDHGMDAWYEAKPRLEHSLDQLEQAYLETKAKFE
jgi:archaellum component FlaC